MLILNMFSCETRFRRCVGTSAPSGSQYFILSREEVLTLLAECSSHRLVKRTGIFNSSFYCLYSCDSQASDKLFPALSILPLYHVHPFCLSLLSFPHVSSTWSIRCILNLTWVSFLLLSILPFLVICHTTWQNHWSLFCNPLVIYQALLYSSVLCKSLSQFSQFLRTPLVSVGLNRSCVLHFLHFIVTFPFQIKLLVC